MSDGTKADYVNEEANDIDYESRKDFRAVFSTPQGRKVLAHLKDLYDGSTVIAGDPVQTYGLSQAREVYLHIKQLSEETLDD